MNRVVKFLNLIRSFTMRTPMWLRLLIVGLCFAVAGIWTITDTGVSGWITAWQLQDGSNTYSPTLSFLLGALVLLMPAGAILIILGTFFPEKSEQETKMKSGLF